MDKLTSVVPIESPFTLIRSTSTRIVNDGFLIIGPVVDKLTR